MTINTIYDSKIEHNYNYWIIMKQFSTRKYVIVFYFIFTKHIHLQKSIVYTWYNCKFKHCWEFYWKKISIGVEGYGERTRSHVWAHVLMPIPKPILQTVCEQNVSKTTQVKTLFLYILINVITLNYKFK